MNEKKFESLLGGSQPNEKHIEELIRLAGQRDNIDPECTERVREHVYHIWLSKQEQSKQEQSKQEQSKQEQSKQEQSKQEQKRLAHQSVILPIKPRWQNPSSLVAGLLVVVVTSLSLYLFSGYYFSGHEQHQVVAEVENIRGKITHQGLALQAGKSVLSGVDINTGHSGRLALKLSDSAVLKLDQYTQIRFIDHQSVELISGALYFDSRQKGNIRVYTEHGVASDIGTRFETRLWQNTLIVRVRDGQVKVQHGENAVLVDSMQALQLAGGTAAISDIPQNDEQWIWADAIDDKFSFDGRSMAEVLFWLAQRENWQLQYESDAAKARARDDILRGQLDTENSRDLLRQLSMISDMQYRFDGNVLLVNYP